MSLWNQIEPVPSGSTVWSDKDAYKGDAASITIGSVEAVEQGNESVTNVGSLTEAVLNFKLPIGDTGLQGIQGNAGTIVVNEVSTGNAGTDVIITNIGSPSQAVLNITIPRGIQGITGSKGWSPIFSVISDGNRRVLKVSDWQGGEGTKPVIDVYMGVAGYTYVLADAVDIRGTTGEQGIQGIKGDTGNTATFKVVSTNSVTGTPSGSVTFLCDNTLAGFKVGHYIYAYTTSVNSYMAGFCTAATSTSVTILSGVSNVSSAYTGWTLILGGKGLEGKSNILTLTSTTSLSLTTGSKVINTVWTGYDHGFTTGMRLRVSCSGGYMEGTVTAFAQTQVTINITLVVGTGTYTAWTIGVTGDIGGQATLVSGANIKTINSTTLLGSGDIAVQPTLVSGTNIKTVYGQSLLGSGNIAPSTYGCSVWKTSGSPAGITGDITNYDAVWDNQGGAFNTTTGVYTVPVVGLYEISFDAIKQDEVAALCEVRLYKNGSPTGVRSYVSAMAGYIPMHFKVRGNFNAGDTLKVRVVAGNIHNNESCYLNIQRVIQ